MAAEENKALDEELDLAPDTVTLTMDDDTDVECAILSIFPAGENQYIALMPLDENGEQKGEDIYLYRFIPHGEEEDPELENIESDDEFEIASDAFDELLDNWEFDEMD